MHKFQWCIYNFKFSSFLNKWILIWIYHSMCRFHFKSKTLLRFLPTFEKIFWRNMDMGIVKYQTTGPRNLNFFHTFSRNDRVFDLAQWFGVIKTTCYKITKTKQWRLPIIPDDTWSNLFYNTSDRHEWHKCIANVTRAKPVRYELGTSHTSVTRVRHERYECNRSEKLRFR